MSETSKRNYETNLLLLFCFRITSWVCIRDTVHLCPKRWLEFAHLYFLTWPESHTRHFLFHWSNKILYKNLNFGVFVSYSYIVIFKVRVNHNSKSTRPIVLEFCTVLLHIIHQVSLGAFLFILIVINFPITN